MQKKILTDVDGVLLNWEYAFHVWMESKGHAPTVVDPGLFWNMAKQYNITDERAMAHVREFNHSAAMGFIPPLRDAHEYVRKLHKEHNYIFHAVTSFTNEEFSVKLRQMNLDKVFSPGVFEHVECLPIGSPKRDYLSQFEGTGYYWLEDSIDNAVDGLELGLKPIIMEHGYTMHFSHPEIPVVKDWKEIYDIVMHTSLVPCQ